MCADRPAPHPEDREEVLQALKGPVGRHARPGALIALVCITEDRRAAELASQRLATGLQEAGVETALRLWANGERWVELNSGAAGNLTQQTADRVATSTVLAGAAQPATSRASLAASLVGHREPITAVLPAARQASDTMTPTLERDWALDRLEQFHTDGNRLSDLDGARMLVALESIDTRDSLWEDMSLENAASHIALWSDLTRRAPDEVRAAPAALLGFSSWLSGDGARAWCALDQVPPDQPYMLAAIVASALQHGLNPREWENAHPRDLADVDESYVPTPPRHQTAQDVAGRSTLSPGEGAHRANPGR